MVDPFKSLPAKYESSSCSISLSTPSVVNLLNFSHFNGTHIEDINPHSNHFSITFSFLSVLSHLIIEYLPHDVSNDELSHTRIEEASALPVSVFIFVALSVSFLMHDFFGGIF